MVDGKRRPKRRRVEPADGMPFQKDSHWDSAVGQPALVVGNSPAVSLLRSEIEGLSGKAIRIGVNRILRTVEVDVVLTVDTSVIEVEKDRYGKFGGSFLFWDGLLKRAGVGKTTARYTAYTFTLAGNRNEKTFKIPRNPGEAYLRIGVTPAYAIQHALVVGCNPIGLVGVDFNAGEMAKNGASHCFGQGKDERATGGGKLREHVKRFFVQFADRAKERGVDVFNLSPYDASPFNKVGWPRITIQEFEALIQRKKVVSE